MGKTGRWKVAAVVAGVAVLGACGTGGLAGEGGTLSLVAFSTPTSAYGSLESAFAQTPEGEGTVWQESFGSSGDQSRAVASGLKADYVHLSLEPDIDRLVDAGLVDENWDQGRTNGVVAESVVVLAVRKGNPQHIDDWDDLTKPGVDIVTPNPGSSGGAKWNVLAAYGAAAQDGGEQAGKDYLRKFFDNVVALPSSARDATTAFTGGTGDVLLSYESEAILARQSGEELDYVVPDTTLLIETPGAVLKNAGPKTRDFMDFVLSREGQTEFARFGWRPVVDGVSVDVSGANDPANPYPEPEKLLTIDDFGGWDKADETFFDEKTGLVTRIQQQAGKS